jgi:hypothetical protein
MIKRVCREKGQGRQTRDDQESLPREGTRTRQRAHAPLHGRVHCTRRGLGRGSVPPAGPRCTSCRAGRRAVQRGRERGPVAREGQGGGGTHGVDHAMVQGGAESREQRRDELPPPGQSESRAATAESVRIMGCCRRVSPSHGLPPLSGVVAPGRPHAPQHPRLWCDHNLGHHTTRTVYTPAAHSLLALPYLAGYSEPAPAHTLQHAHSTAHTLQHVHSTARTLYRPCRAGTRGQARHVCPPRPHPLPHHQQSAAGLCQLWAGSCVRAK